MNLLAIISDNTNYTLHSHTQYCDGRATMDEMARAAVEQGMTVYGFTPHSPIPFDSPCNMSADAVGDFLREADRIAAAYAGRCRFLKGMEVDYIGSEWGPHSEYFKSLPLDYTIGSVHFIPTQDGEPVDIDGKFESFRRKMADRFRDDIDYVVDTFFRQSMDMLAAGGFDILGHFDKIGQNASYYAPGIEGGSHYRGLLRQYMDRITASGVIVELNTKAYHEHGRFFPSAALLPELVAAGVPVVVNSDAHYPDRICAGRAEGLRALAEAALKLTPV